jgi:hypothetical protein
MVFERRQWTLNVVVALFSCCLVGGLVVVAVVVVVVAVAVAVPVAVVAVAVAGAVAVAVAVAVAAITTLDSNWMRDRTDCPNVMI